MAYTLDCTASSVAIGSITTDTRTGVSTGSLSGNASFQVLDGTTVVSSFSIPASGDVSGSISDNGTQVTAGRNGNWSLNVSWARTGAATGTTVGSYQNTSLQTGVGVAVDHGGKPHHKKGEQRPAKK